MQVTCSLCIASLADNNTSNAQKFAVMGVPTHLLKMLKSSPGEEEVQRCGWLALARIAAFDQRTSQNIGNLRGCEMVINVFKDFRNRPGVYGSALEALGALAARSEINKAKLWGLNVGEFILHGLKRFPEDEVIAAGGCYNLGIFSSNSIKNAEELVGRGACDLLVKATAAFPALAIIQIRALHAIAVLIDQHTDKLSQLGVMQLVFKAMDKFPGDKSVIVDGLYCCVSLAQKNLDSRKALLDRNIAKVIVCALQKFPSDIEVQGRCLDAVATFVERNGYYSDLFVYCGAPEATIKSMKAFISDQRVQTTGCCIIAKMARNSDEANKNFGEVGACQAVVDAFRNFGHDRDFLSEGYAAIKSLAANLQNSQGLGELGMCTTLVSCVKNTKDNDLEILGADCLWMLASNNQENRRRLSDAGGADLVQSLLNRMPENRQVQSSGFYSLAFLSSVGKDHMDTEMCCRLILNGLKEFPSKEDFQEQGCYAAFALCSIRPDVKARLRANGACELLAASCKRMAHCPIVFSQALLAVSELAKGSREYIGLFGSLGLCGVIRYALEKHTDKLVHSRALDTIELLANHTENRQRLGKRYYITNPFPPSYFPWKLTFARDYTLFGARQATDMPFLFYAY